MLDSSMGTRIVSAAVCVSLFAPAAASAATIRPLQDRVLIVRDDDRPRGIILPDAAKEKPARGLVIAVGPGRVDDGQRVPVDVRPGDRVLFGGYAGTEVREDGADFLILREDDILAVLED